MTIVVLSITYILLLIVYYKGHTEGHEQQFFIN